MEFICEAIETRLPGLDHHRLLHGGDGMEELVPFSVNHVAEPGRPSGWGKALENPDRGRGWISRGVAGLPAAPACFPHIPPGACYNPPADVDAKLPFCFFL